MPVIDFGKTWWGKKWLDSLSDIDFDNRLPRGKTYARKGMVVDIQISKNSIKARVKGSRKTPYQQQIRIKPFTKQEKETIIQTIISNPNFVSKLLNKELPRELFDQLNRKKIHLFPEKWSELLGLCSCPDWAVPCKHLAAVIYMIANEIDKNPFLIFNLNQFDLLNELEMKGYQANQVIYNDFQHLDQIWNKHCKMEQNYQPIDLEALKAIDFSLLPDASDNLFKILPDAPLFYTRGNFKTLYEQVIRKIQSQVKDFMTDQPEQEAGCTFGEEIKAIDCLVVNLEMEINIIKKQTGQDFSQHEWLKNLVCFFNKNCLENMLSLNDKIVYLHQVFHFALNLLYCNAYIPQLVKINPGSFKIRWLPALLCAPVKQLFQELKALYPADLVAFLDQKQSAYLFPCIEEQLLMLCHFFLSFFIRQYAPHGPDWENEICKLFFKNLSYQPGQAFDQQHNAIAIQSWLSRFYMIDRQYTPVLQIDYLDQFYTISILLEKNNSQWQAPIPLPAFFKEEKYQSAKTVVMKDLSLLAEYFPALQTIIESGGEKKLSLHCEDFPDLFYNILPVIKILGIKLLLPRQLHQVLIPKPTLALSQKTRTSQAVSYLSLDHMIKFKWKIALGDRIISKKEFLDLVNNYSGIVRLKNQFIYLNKADVSKILKDLEQEPSLKKQEILAIGLDEEYENNKIEITEPVRKIFKQFMAVKEIALPRYLQADLRDYQKRGYMWLYKNARLGFGSLIADDMGLGKTVQVLALLAKFKEENKLKNKKALIIVPTTLLSNWQKEISKFTPCLNSQVFHGQKRLLQAAEHDLVLTTYGLIRTQTELFTSLKWQIIIIDEAQNIKNHASAQSKSIKKLNAVHKIAMSGTPVENRLAEFWSIFDFLNADYLGSEKYFYTRFSLPIEKLRDHKKMHELKKITGPFVLRRLKNDQTIINDLPGKLEFDHFCSLTKEQLALYQTVINKTLTSIENLEGIKRKGLIFQLMTHLKQICNHPAHYLKNPDLDPGLSGKTINLLEILKKVYANNEKILIFTQYKEMGLILTRLLKNEFQKEIPFLHGGIPRQKRAQLIELFQNQREVNTFILTLKAGGTGLNLTAASNVIHFDLWWNPAVENQATDRAYRIGQQKKVVVHRLISLQTFEERINEMIKSKKELADLTVNQGEKWIGELSNRELKTIFSIQKAGRE